MPNHERNPYLCDVIQDFITLIFVVCALFYVGIKIYRFFVKGATSCDHCCKSCSFRKNRKNER
jgi:hypothetical protein